jgi:molecular chaperone DnaJ
MKNPYQVLGVEENANENEIKKAYRNLALQHHPDRNPNDPKAESKFKDISAAYEVLSNPETKAKYDKWGDLEDHFDFPDLGGFGINLGDLFGGGFGSDRVVENISTSVSISFMEAAKGCERKVPIERFSDCSACKGNGSKNGTSIKECEICHGQGKTTRVQGNMRFIQSCYACGGVGHSIDKKCEKCAGIGSIREEEKVKVSIPAGVDNGVSLRIRGKGKVNKAGRAGDLLLKINVARHSIFTKVGRNIRSEKSIDYLDAILGCELSVETISGNVKMKIPAGTQPEAMFKIPRKGINTGGSCGDHMVKVKVQIPKKINKEKRKILERLRKNG